MIDALEAPIALNNIELIGDPVTTDPYALESFLSLIEGIIKRMTSEGTSNEHYGYSDRQAG